MQPAHACGSGHKMIVIVMTYNKVHACSHALTYAREMSPFNYIVQLANSKVTLGFRRRRKPTLRKSLLFFILHAFVAALARVAAGRGRRESHRASRVCGS